MMIVVVEVAPSSFFLVNGGGEGIRKGCPPNQRIALEPVVGAQKRKINNKLDQPRKKKRSSMEQDNKPRTYSLCVCVCVCMYVCQFH
mmetsp:Transcript_39039/g.43711  ORF Transcript_39039/g.43711 Transcript_39039/m.43711 type:complete len:87 (-) Transcript_39039:32-292(-)